MGAGILPTPAIGGVGVVDDVAKTATLAFKRAGEAILLVGGAPSWLGRSAYLGVVLGREEGAPPPVDLALERRHGEFVLRLIRDGLVTAVHDLSDGGLALAVAEMAIKGGVGARLARPLGPEPLHAYFFGEDQGRYLVTTPAVGAVLAAAAAAGVAAAPIGETGGNVLALPDEAPIPLAALSRAYESWMPAYMG